MKRVLNKILTLIILVIVIASSITIYNTKDNDCYYIALDKDKIQLFKDIFESKEINSNKSINRKKKS